MAPLGPGHGPGRVPQTASLTARSGAMVIFARKRLWDARASGRDAVTVHLQVQASIQKDWQPVAVVRVHQGEEQYEIEDQVHRHHIGQ